jgi:3-methyladenine DNA glycosylase/8-oxoguanine DNA glycosylase
MQQTIFLETPKIFDFKRTVLSHGWSQLAPFQIDTENWKLDGVLVAEKPHHVEITEAEKGLNIKIFSQPVSAQKNEKILGDIRHIFRFDDDLGEFYKLTKSEKKFAWIAKQNAGRLLRSPTVFEDLVKTICTTNCNWAMTKIMTTNLVEKLGEISENGKKAFPTAEAMAKMPVEFYKDEIRAGYRALYFKELTEKIVKGALDVESWLNSDLPTKELKKEMKRVKGVGDYAAENLLKLLGRYDGLALDSFLRGGFYKKHNNEIVCNDKDIAAHYERFGKWRGLAIWCDMTEKWM